MAVPDTTTFTLQDVVTEVIPTTDDLVDCFADAISDRFDPAYSGSKNNLLNFRNYNNDLYPCANNAWHYGYLYNWYATEHTNFAPTGWHKPTVAEWQSLRDDVYGGATVAGGPLKEACLDHWTTPNTGATNISRLTYMGGGVRRADNGTFEDLKVWGYLWSNDISRGPALQYNSAVVFELINALAQRGHNVRFVKDSTTLTDGQTSTITDADGNVYDTICMGGPGYEQEWTVQNWKCTKLKDGTPLTKVTSNATWIVAGTTDYYYCAYDNNEANV